MQNVHKGHLWKTICSFIWYLEIWGSLPRSYATLSPALGALPSLVSGRMWEWGERGGAGNPSHTALSPPHFLPPRPAPPLSPDFCSASEFRSSATSGVPPSLIPEAVGSHSSASSGPFPNPGSSLVLVAWGDGLPAASGLPACPERPTCVSRAAMEQMGFSDNQVEVWFYLS